MLSDHETQRTISANLRRILAERDLMQSDLARNG